MDQSEMPEWFRRHRWWIQLLLDAAAVAGVIVGCVTPFMV